VMARLLMSHGEGFAPDRNSPQINNVFHSHVGSTATRPSLERTPIEEQWFGRSTP
jgi:hypothetical protein